MKERSFKLYIFRLLKKIDPKIRITKSALESLDSIIRVLGDKLTSDSLSLLSTTEMKTLTDREILSAFKIFFPKETIEKDVLSMIGKAETLKMERSISRNVSHEAGATREKRETRENRLGMIFSVSLCENILRQFGTSSVHVSSLAPVCLASILENICKNLLQSSIETTVNAQRSTISVRNLFLSSNELGLIKALNVFFVESGSIPTLKDKKRDRCSINIRKLQRSSSFLIQRAPFNRMVREVTDIFNSDKIPMKFTRDFFDILHSYIENNLILLMKNSYRLASHDGRETCYARDIVLMMELTNISASVDNEVKSHIPEASIRKVALRAGIKRYGEDCTEVFRKWISSTLVDILSKNIEIAKLSKVQTLSAKILISYFHLQGINPAVIHHKRKTVKKDRSTSTDSTSSVVNDEDTINNVNSVDLEESISSGELEPPELSDIEENDDDNVEKDEK